MMPTVTSRAAVAPRALRRAGRGERGLGRSAIEAPLGRLVVGALVSLALFALTALPAMAQGKRGSAAKPTANAPSAASAAQALRYAGVLQDEKGAPIGGVFRLEFALYPTKTSQKLLWSEQHWVAVDAGKYVVTLGEQKPLPPITQLERLFVGVSIPGVGEILRERLMVQADPADAAPESGADGTARGGARGAKGEGGVTDYAEKAGFAYEAELAANSSKFAGMTVEELEKKLVKPPRVGTKSTATEPAGGQGGYAFEHVCPKGYVVTGMKGAAGLYVDSIQLICSPLE